MQTVANLNSPIPDFCCELSDAGVIHFAGEEAGKYLQGQVTADVNRLDGQQALIACHCDFKGKTWNIGYLAGDQAEIFMLCHSGAIDASLAELKKYGVFAKVDIEDVSSTYTTLGGAGTELTSALSSIFGGLPSKHLEVLRGEDGLVMRIDSPSERYLTILNESGKSRFNELYTSELWSAELWEAMDISAGVANIQAATSNEFVPQMMNMQSVDAISFEKGCYMGQEVVARTKFLGKNKRAAFILKSDATADVEAGDTLEMQIGENWRRGGTVLRSARLDQQSWLLAVLANDTEVGNILRLKAAPDVQFEVQALPYELSE